MYDDYKTALEIKAVVADIPLNTHFRFDLLTKLPEFGWGGLEYYTYVKFREGTDYAAAIEKCNAVNKNLLETRFNGYGDSKFGSITEPLNGIHIGTQSSFDLTPKTSKANLIFIILVTVFILAIALSNFISLNIIQGEKRATEISVRKTNGAERSNIVKMLFSETTLVTLLSFIIAIVFYYVFSTPFARLINFNLPADVGITGVMWGYFILLFCL